VTFEKDRQKDDVAERYLATFDGDEAVLLIGTAQKKASVFCTEKRRDAAGKDVSLVHPPDGICLYFHDATKLC
jgi:hypothetical protein